jgi:hypothetical protein
MTDQRVRLRSARLLTTTARRGILTVAIAAGTIVGLAGTASAATAHQQAGASAGPAVAVRAFQPGGVMTAPAGAARASAHARANETVESNNWSGYAATGSDGDFTSVSASWTQPAATCTNGGGRRGPGGGGGRRGPGGQEFAAFWVGLDGFNSDSVEQTGTDSDCDGTTPQYYGWYEMFPAAPVDFTNPVEPGDSISASVTTSATETYTLVLTDSTQDWTQTITQDESGLDRSSAEVIAEAPSSGNSILPLADFGTVNYTAASANGASLAGQDPTEINMEGDNGELKDQTSAISSTGAFSDTWISSS